MRSDSTAEIAAMHRYRAELGLRGGHLVANPIPPAAEIDRETMLPIIETAQADADAQGVMGKDVTPFLLSRIYELTEGRSLTANIALVLNNARLAAKIARSLAD